MDLALMLSLFLVAALGLVRGIPEYFVRQSYQRSGKDTSCRCFPGDACWPSKHEWSRFNKTLGGKLIATVPIASVCHESSFGQYDAARCEELRSIWGFPETHYTSSSSPMAPFFANASCDPFTTPDTQCTLGTYVQYAVNASCVQDYQKTLDFAQEKNIRLVIRNTGHDYLGKSTGAGAIALWTHNIKDIEIVEYKSGNYEGPAMKTGAGVQGFEAQNAAHKQGLLVVTGNCPTVGIAGGYTQGGGHSPLSSKFGLAADQVLEWEVVTGEGKFMVASPSENPDLYWALSGGGGGTYAAVLSMTVKAYPDLPTAGGNLTFTTEGISQEAFYDAVQLFLTTLPNLVDAGVVPIWLVVPGLFLVQPIIAPGMTKDELQSLLEPTLARLKESGISHSFFVDDFPTYLDSFTTISHPPNVTMANLGGRFIPRSLVQGDSVASLTQALRFVVDNGGILSGIPINVADVSAPGANSVNPQWRDAVFVAVLGIPYNIEKFEANFQAMDQVTDVLVPRLEKLTPEGGAYLNEADPNQPDFQRVFYGKNYAKLREVKRKYDPFDIFYGLTSVGSDEWEVKSDGRLCKIG